METVPLLEGVIRARALVFGSLPPSGRDIDLLVQPGEIEHLAQALTRSGFTRRGTSFVSFASHPPVPIDLIPADSWDLPVGELRLLFDEAVPLPGGRHLVRPAPHHALLILARRAVRGGSLEDRFRARVDAALAEDPLAFAIARERAAAWGAGGSLALLERAHARGEDPSTLARAAAIAAELRIRGRGPTEIAKGTARGLLRRPRRGFVIALSGLDGAGKSTQGRMLADSLSQLGFEPQLEWPAIDAPSRVMALLTRVGKGTIKMLARTPGRGGGGEAVADPARALRQRSELVTFAWSSLYALRGAGRVARATWPHVLGGRVAICDRYLLDTRVFLRHRYGEDRRYRLQLGLIRLLSPRPRAAFLLVVSPETATARQPERTVAENAERTRLYLDAAAELGVEPVDGEAAEEKVAAELARRVWLALG